MNSALPKSRLGRGLASLIGEAPQSQPRLPAEGEQRLCPVDQLRSGRFNPRKDFAEQDLAELSESIRTKGLVQPIVVRPHPEDDQAYEIVAGERRWRASQKAGLHVVPVIVRDLSDREVLELAIIENVQRADLNAIEEAGGYRELIERFDYSQEQVSEIIGKSRSHVANTLRLLKLPAQVQAFVLDGRLTAGHARALVGRDDAEALAARIVEQGLNVREAEALGQAGPIGVAGSTGARKVRDKDPDTKAFEKELADTLGLKVEVKRGSGESGNLVIKYGNFDQLDYIRMRLTGSQGG
ncbi:ParB/RepB/Spo0J family partition protein [Hyphomicrobium sp.]|uniref:ParB/RepB/Spo0J family partition protein n=1 Tax=Hyphomicrobium sp. TaxID=82 RepID=UPI003F7086E8